jgi:3-methyladenine DNA glycosylase AlkD
MSLPRVPAERAGGAMPTRRDDLQKVVAWLKRTGTARVRDGMARYAIPSHNALGVAVGALRKYSVGLGRDHDLAVALWDTGWYEARMLAAFIDEPALVTVRQMDRWCRQFDSWAICDHLCFHLFDRTPHAWRRIEPWSRHEQEFSKRAAFALLWGLSVHDKAAPDDAFLSALPLIERAAHDDRNFVKKAVDMALRAIGKRNGVLHTAALASARRLSEERTPSARWVGKSAVRELTSAAMARRRELFLLRTP